MANPARFWDRNAKRYARSPIADQDAYERKLEITRGYFTPESEVLEFGCGTGSTALLHAPHVRHILATDYAAGMLQIARQKASDQGIENVTFTQSSIEEFRTDRRFDAVLCLSLLHLVADRPAALARAFELLKTGGVLISSTACLGERMGYLRYIAPLGRAIGVFPMFKIFTRDTLVGEIRAAGFELDYEWLPKGAVAIFLVAKKP